MSILESTSVKQMMPIAPVIAVPIIFVHMPAWSSAMNMHNVLAGFKCTGTYPLDRTVLIPKDEISEKDSVTSNLTTHTGPFVQSDKAL